MLSASAIQHLVLPLQMQRGAMYFKRNRLSCNKGELERGNVQTPEYSFAAFFLQTPFNNRNISLTNPNSLGSGILSFCYGEMENSKYAPPVTTT